MKLNEIQDNDGARKSRVRVGRGIGSGVGKTGGRGVKGQKSRSGVSIKGFEGGQMPLHMRLPKRGFNKPNRVEYSEINIGGLQRMVDAGRIEAGASLDADALVLAGILTHPRDGVRLLGKGAITAALNLTVAGASAAAVKAVEAAGGSVTIVPVKRVVVEKAEKAA